MSRTMLISLSMEKSLYDELTKTLEDQSVIDEARETVKDLVGTQVAAIATLQTNAAAAKTALSNFEEQCKKDQIALNSQNSIVTSASSGDNGDIATLQQKIKDNNASLSSDEDKYDEGIRVFFYLRESLHSELRITNHIRRHHCRDSSHICMVVSSLISIDNDLIQTSSPIGTVIAAVIMGFYGAGAVDMAGKVAGLKVLLSDENDQIKADKLLVADLTLIQVSSPTSTASAIYHSSFTYFRSSTSHR